LLGLGLGLEAKFSGLGLGLETSGLGLEALALALRLPALLTSLGSPPAHWARSTASAPDREERRRGSPLAHACHVCLTSVNAIASYPAHRQTERHNE